jgi:hypothetical protein
MKRISIYDFSFRLIGHGAYRVCFESPVTSKCWYATVTDMTLIDATKNSDNPKVKDLIALKRACKNG